MICDFAADINMIKILSSAPLLCLGLWPIHVLPWLAELPVRVQTLPDISTNQAITGAEKRQNMAKAVLL